MIAVAVRAVVRDLVLSLLVCGCGGATFSAPGGGGGDGGEAGGDDGGLSPACPASIPATGTACTGTLACEYGNDPSVACDSVATCASGAWSVLPPARAFCGTNNPPTCPASFGSVEGETTCTPIQLDCLYPEARCHCSPSSCLGGPCHIEPDGGQPPPVWVCNVPTGGNCPIPRPRIGSSCSQNGRTCDYGSCTGGVSLVCASGVWQDEPVGCPAAAGG
jgi:hypothetical protein